MQTTKDPNEAIKHIKQVGNQVKFRLKPGMVRVECQWWWDVWQDEKHGKMWNIYRKGKKFRGLGQEDFQIAIENWFLRCAELDNVDFILLSQCP